MPDPLPLDGPGAQVRLLEGVAAVISAACEGPQPGVVLLDDVHAADEATLDAISYLGRRLSGRALLLVISWRSEAVPPGHRLRRLAAGPGARRKGRDREPRPARRGRGRERSCRRLSRTHAAPELARRVYLESEGLPLFVAEYLAALRAGGDRREELLPTEVRSLLDARLGGLGDVARQVLGAAAAIGRSFDLDTVRQASGRSDEETVGALEELVAQGVVREVPGAGARLRLLAPEAPRAGLRADRPGAAPPAPRARRRPRCRGDGRARRARRSSLSTCAWPAIDAGAAEHYRLAAEHAASLHAHADALEHLEAALALGDPDAAGLHERIGDLRTLLGDYAGALASYESAAAECEPSALAAIEHKLGGVHHRRGEWERAEARLLAALDAAAAEERGLRARIQADLALTLHQAGRPERATALGRARPSSSPRPPPIGAPQAQAHNMLGVLARNAGEPQPARAELERSLALAEELGDDPAQAAALNNLALVKRDAGELAEALALTESALALCAAYGDRHREAALENNLADLHHAAGDDDDAMVHLKRAVAIFTEVGADEATRLPEIWKLVSW